MNAARAALGFLVCVVSAPAAVAVPPTFTVNSVGDVVDADPGDGHCETMSPGVCTLRAAIMEANHTTGGGATVVVPNLGAPYVLTIPPGDGTESTGSLKVTANMTIQGAGAAATIVDGNAASRVLTVLYPYVATISGLTFRNGKSLSTNDGGGGTNSDGGGILSYGTLTLIGCFLTNNQTNMGGGGLATLQGSATILESLISSNTASAGGGGIEALGSVTMTNSTVSGNFANDYGGGLLAEGTVDVYNSTITLNTADADFNGSGEGGGVFAGNHTLASFTNTILADNSETYFTLGNYLPSPGDCAGTDFGGSIHANGHVIVAGYDTGRCTITGAPGAFTLTEPLLGTLKFNGGQTPTHALLPGSPALDKIAPAACLDSQAGPLLHDQRGAHRPTGGMCDIGAYEHDANGDVNGDGARGVSDVFYLINFLFAGGPAPMGLGDVNGDAEMDVADVFYLINFLFAGGPAPL